MSGALRLRRWQRNISRPMMISAYRGTSGPYSRAARFFLLLLAACYLAAEIVLPSVLAFVLMLLLQPTMRFLERWHVPRGLAALAIILLLFAAIAGLTTALTGPAADWAAKLPEGLPKLQ